MLLLFVFFGSSIHTLSEKCSKCMKKTQRFLNQQNLNNVSSYDICEKASVCEPRKSVDTSEIAKIALKTTIRSTIGKFDEDEEKIATEELLNIFDNFYTEFNDVLSRALNEEDVKDMIKQVLEIIRKEKQNGPLTQTVVPRILLMIAEIVLNNKTLNQVAQEEFEKLTGVTVDAE